MTSGKILNSGSGDAHRGAPRAPAFVVVKAPEVLVIGGGIIGLATAYVLSERGLRVEVLEAGPEGPSTGSSATQASAGMISPLIETTESAVLAAICRNARDVWPNWAEWLSDESRLDLHFQAGGTLFPAFGSADMQELDRAQQQAERLAEDWERWSPDQVDEFIPTLRSGCLSALYLPNEYSVAPQAVATALRQLLRRRGVVVHHGRRVQRIVSEPGAVQLQGRGWSASGQKVIVAAGTGSAALDAVGSLPIVPVRGQMISFSAPTGQFSANLRLGSHYALCRGAELLVGATEEHVGFDDSTTEAGRDELRDWALRLFPGLRWKAVSRHWAGLRPLAEDGLPMIGCMEDERIVVATGHHRNGVLLAPWTARVVADLMVHGSAKDLPDELSPQRF